MLHTRFRGPIACLEPFIRFYTEREVKIRGLAVVHPVTARACPMIEFSLGESMDVVDYKRREGRKAPRAVAVGAQTFRRVDLQLQGNLHSFVIMFRPDGIYRLFSLPMDEMTDRDYEAHSLLGSFISQVRQRLGECRSFAERIDVANEVLIKHALQARDFDGVSAAASQIMRTGGRIDIPTLAHKAGLSLRQFERRFIKQVGMRPKLLARIARFEGALAHKASFVRNSWTDVAHEFGYYDQMHMVHDFGEFTGGTPTETLAQLEGLFGDQIRRVRAGTVTDGDGGDSRLIF